MGLELSVLIGALAFGWTMWAVLFWGSIAIIERHNPYNTFGWALAWSAIELGVAMGMSAMGIAGFGLLLAWLVFLLRLLLGRYELGLLHAICVVITTIAGPYFVTDAFLAFVGSSEALFLIALYGVPLTVLVVWRWPRPAPEAPTNLPPARVARIWRRQRAAPAAPARPPAPAATPPPAAAAPGPAATATATTTAAPAPAPPADRGPSFLR